MGAVGALRGDEASGGASEGAGGEGGCGERGAQGQRRTLHAALVREEGLEAGSSHRPLLTAMEARAAASAGEADSGTERPEAVRPTQPQRKRSSGAATPRAAATWNSPSLAMKEPSWAA